MSRGQAMVEFAMVLPLLALLLVMAVDFGRVFFGWVALHNTARIGADFAAQHADAWPTASDSASMDARAEYQTIMMNDLDGANCSYDEPLPVPTFEDTDGDGDEKGWGDHAVVELTCVFGLITPLAEGILGGPVDLAASARFAIHGSIVGGLPEPPPPVTPTPVPTPTPGPTNCTAPDYRTLRANDAENLWDASDFTGTFVRDGSGNFVIASQSLTAGQTVPCTSSITVSSNASMTPAPTPTPTPVPTPTPLGTPTPTPVPTPTPTPCPPPLANFTWTPQTPVRQQNVQFTDTSTTAADCPITSWNWSFGDGTTSAAQHPVKKYNFTGPAASQQFTVTLTVSNSGGGATSTQTITVNR